MPRNSYRGLTLALVLILSLGMTLPAAAAGRTPATQDGLLTRLWDWVERLWSGVPKDGKAWTPAQAADAGCTSHNRGILIDPYGSPCGQ